MDTVNITINGREYTVPAGITILEAARQNGIHIPTLCFLKDLNQIGACRMCLVEVEGAKALQASCVYPVSEGMVVRTDSPAVCKSRKAILELILSNHDCKCYTCIRSGNCELQTLARNLNVNRVEFEGKNINYEIDDLSSSIIRDNNKCVLCRRCIAACEKQGTAVLTAKNRGFRTSVGPIYDKSLKDVGCMMCGQCIQACPTGALQGNSHLKQVWKAINKPELHVVFQTAPAVRAALGEEFGLPIGTPVTGKMVAAIRRMGVDKVFDTNTGADLTIMEEGTELLDRLQNGGTLPMITSCSPGWIKFCENNYPDLLPHLSSCKSPHTMLGAIIKSYYAKKQGIDPHNIYVVSVMPCTAKKYEIERPEMEVDGLRDVDAVITTRCLARMIKEKCIDFVNLPEEEFDSPMGGATGAAVIFGTTGGVMEAALRTVGEVVKGEHLDEIEFQSIRGQKDKRKEVVVDLPGMKLKGCVVSGTGNAKALLDEIRAGECEYHFIEIMGCPGGCVLGGGQPILDAATRNSGIDVFDLRSKALYSEDRGSKLRRSHENPYVQMMYAEYLEEPNSEKAHHLLHTTYSAKEKMPLDLPSRKSINVKTK